MSLYKRLILSGLLIISLFMIGCNSSADDSSLTDLQKLERDLANESVTDISVNQNATSNLLNNNSDRKVILRKPINSTTIVTPVGETVAVSKSELSEVSKITNDHYNVIAESVIAELTGMSKEEIAETVSESTDSRPYIAIAKNEGISRFYLSEVNDRMTILRAEVVKEQYNAGEISTEKFNKIIDRINNRSEKGVVKEKTAKEVKAVRDIKKTVKSKGTKYDGQ